MIMQELWARVGGGGEVFVAFDDHNGRIGEFYHHIKTFHFGADQIIEILTGLAQHVHHHGGDGSFAVTSGNHHAGFLFGMLVKIFRKGVDF